MIRSIDWDRIAENNGCLAEPANTFAKSRMVVMRETVCENAMVQ